MVFIVLVSTQNRIQKTVGEQKPRERPLNDFSQIVRVKVKSKAISVTGPGGL
jgi:hypothetical protein